MAKKNKIDEADLIKVSALFLQGLSESEIATSLNLTKTSVKDAIKTLKKRFLDDADKDKEELRSIELAKASHLERIYWDGFQKSQTFTVKTVEAEGSDGEKPKTKSVIVRTEIGAGNPQFLLGVERCATRRIRLHGLEKSTDPEVAAELRVLHEVVTPNETQEEGS